MKIALLMAGVVLCSSSIAGQAPSVGGTWSVDAPAASGVNDAGGEWSVSAQTGTLTLTQDGAVVTGEWKNRMPKSWAVTGDIQGDQVQLRTEFRDLPMVIDGEKTTQRRRWVFSGVVAADSFTGTMALESDSRRGTEQKFTATRQR